MPSVTCIMPAFQQAEYMQEAVASILGQSYANLKLLIVSVMGDDATGDMVKDLVDRYPDRVASVQSHYACIPHQMNLGFSRVTTDYAFLAASDDIWLPDTCENYVRVAEEANAVVVYPSWYVGTASGAIVGVRTDVPSRFDPVLIEKRCFITDCSLVRTAVFKRFLPMRLESGWFFIYDVWKRVARVHGDRFVPLGSPAFIYRQHEKSEHETKVATNERKYLPVTIGDAPAMYRDWPAANGRLSNKQIAYTGDPAALLGKEADVLFRKVLVHWTRETYTRALVDALAKRSYIHLADDPAIGELPQPHYRLTPKRDVRWWVYNDIYPGLGET